MTYNEELIFLFRFFMYHYIFVSQKDPQGICSVRYKDDISAQACIRVMHGRFFAGRRVEAELYDGTTKYRRSGDASENKIEAEDTHQNEETGREDEGEAEKEERMRLANYGKWLESQNDI